MPLDKDMLFLNCWSFWVFGICGGGWLEWLKWLNKRETKEEGKINGKEKEIKWKINENRMENKWKINEKWKTAPLGFRDFSPRNCPVWLFFFVKISRLTTLGGSSLLFSHGYWRRRHCLFADQTQTKDEERVIQLSKKRETPGVDIITLPELRKNTTFSVIDLVLSSLQSLPSNERESRYEFT